MAVVIRLMRAGAKKRPFYRMVAADSRRQRDGRFLEILGHYNPVADPFELVVQKDKVEAWISKGAQPSEQVASLLRKLGIVTRSQPAAHAASVEAPAAAPVARPGKAAKATSAKPAKRAVKRSVSARKTKARAARKAGKKPAVKKSAKS
ncbi:MAG TPA: 30S ribosomal protein S16 [Candidatus Sulfotelmatobacter sp.]|nr:30S ribosomal protein S16 [Candidatus Sulfotelmatobacter sp.]